MIYSKQESVQMEMIVIVCLPHNRQKSYWRSKRRMNIFQLTVLCIARKAIRSFAEMQTVFVLQEKWVFKRAPQKKRAFQDLITTGHVLWKDKTFCRCQVVGFYHDFTIITGTEHLPQETPCLTTWPAMEGWLCVCLCQGVKLSNFLSSNVKQQCIGLSDLTFGNWWNSFLCVSE